MKKSISILLFVFIALFSTQAFAGGSADIPFWEYYRESKNDNFLSPEFFITNRGEEEVRVTITLYNITGNPVTQLCAYSTDDDGPFAPNNYQMVIPAHSLKSLSIRYGEQPHNLRGTGKISWEYTQESSVRSEIMRKPLSVTLVTNRGIHHPAGLFRAMSREKIWVNGDVWF